MAAAAAQALLNKPFFVGLRAPADLSRIEEVLQEHLQWIVAAEKRGEIFGSGPFVGDRVPLGVLGGMTILRAANLEEAKRILTQDPFILHGIYTLEVRKWLLMEGGFSINVSFSDQNYRLL